MASNGIEKSNGEADYLNNSIHHVNETTLAVNGSNVCTNQKDNYKTCNQTACNNSITKSTDSEKENGLSKDVVSEEIARHKAFKWCRESIGGSWLKVQSERELVVSHISLGMTNYLYLISLPANLAKTSLDSEPKEVLLRIYGEISKSTMDFLVHNSIVFALLAEKKLGPKPFGMYHDGRIEEFIKADPLVPSDLRKPEVVSLVAAKLSKFHSLDMPLSKKPSWFKTIVRGWLKDISNNFSAASRTLNEVQKFAPPSFDLHNEYQELMTIASNLQAPVVFCHNDLQGGNLLLAPNNSPCPDKMTIIDWEYSHYNYRGFDLGNHFNEWMFDYSSPGKPGFQCIPEYYPSKEQQYKFFSIYLESIEGNEVTEDSLYQLYREVNTLAMHSHFLWGVWGIIQALTSSIEFDYVAYSLCRFREYFKLKERLPVMLGNES